MEKEPKKTFKPVHNLSLKKNTSSRSFHRKKGREISMRKAE